MLSLIKNGRSSGGEGPAAASPAWGMTWGECAERQAPVMLTVRNQARQRE